MGYVRRKKYMKMGCMVAKEDGVSREKCLYLFSAYILEQTEGD